MAKEKTYSTITKQKIASAKGLQLACAALTLILDAVALVLLYNNTSELKYFICPGLLLVLDVVFVIKALFSNYRFAYAIKGVYAHIVSVILVCAGMVVLEEFLDERIVFATLALYAVPAVHLIQCVASLLCALHAEDKRSVGRSAGAIVLSALLAGSIVFYGVFIFGNGYFGQSRERTLVYSFDEENGYYVASGVLNGIGGTVIIPETFDGLPVGAVDCNLFSAKRLMRVVFDCDPEIEFLHTDKLQSANAGLKIETKKDNLDALRTHMYALSEKNVGFIELANNTAPYDMEDGSIYLTFCYDKSSLATADGKILPTWFGSRTDSFNVYSHAAGVDYIEHSNAADVANLYWCEKNQGGKIFQSVRNAEGENANSVNVYESGKLNVTFEQIYRINIGEDNDTVYTLSEVYTSINTEDGPKQYRLATADRVMTILENLPLRNGFDRSFQIGSDKHELTDMAYEISLMDQAGITEINVYPHWQLRAPTITSIAADGVSSGHSAVYGSNVKLTAEANAPHESISVKYEWKKTGFTANTAECTVENLQPGDAGEYVLTVTAYADTTSLEATATKSVTVGFEKKTLHYSWILPEDKVYSASNKAFTFTPSQNDIINGDTVTQDVIIQLAGGRVENVRNAGSYTIQLELTGDAATKYQIYALGTENDGVRKLEIEPCAVQVQWSETVSFVYNGSSQSPDASVQGLGEDTVAVTVSGKNKDVGRYSAIATTANTNYRLVGASTNYSITPKPISAVVWDENTSFVYNSEEQYPKVLSLEGLTAEDKTNVMNAIVYSGKQTNAGSDYTVTVSLADTFPSRNYELVSGMSKNYTIAKKTMTITVADQTFEYTGMSLLDGSKYFFTTSDAAKNDKIEEIAALAYKTYVGGVETTPINVVSSGYTISGDLVPGEKYGNYEISIVTGTLTVTPKALTLQVNDLTKVYDGMPFYGEYTFEAKGLVSVDRIAEVVREMTYTKVQDKNAGKYNIRAEVQSGGQGEKYGNYTVTVVPGTLVIEKAKLTVVAIGSTKVYDGYTFETSQFGFAIESGNLYEGITPAELGTPIFGGKAIVERNAGTHVLEIINFSPNAVNSNYAITYLKGEVVITPKPISITAKDTTKTYDGLKGGAFDFEVGADQLASGDTKLSLGTISYGGAGSTATNVGEYEVIVEDIENPNYMLAEKYAGTFTITKKSVTVTPVAVSRTYNGTVSGTFSVTVSGLVNGETAAILGTPKFSGSATTAKNAGTYTLNVEYPTEPQNYTVSRYDSAIFIITKASFEINMTALSKVYDGKAVEAGSIPYTISGLCAGDTASMLGTPQYSGTLTTNNLGTAGSHTLTVSIPGNENYEAKSATFNYTIIPKEITVSAVAEDRVYDGTAGGKFSITADGLVEGEDVSVLGTPDFYGDAKTAINAGTYTLKVQFNGSTGNYKVTQFKNTTFTIKPKEVTVTAIATDRAYEEGRVGGEFSFRIEGLVTGSEKNFTATYGGSAVQATEKGTYELTVEITPKNKNNNYTFKYVAARFTIS